MKFIKHKFRWCFESCLSTIRAERLCNFIILFKFVLFPIPQTMHSYSMTDDI